VEIVAFDKGQRKDEVTRERLKTFCGSEGVLYIGKAQERFAIFRVIKRISVHNGQPYPWLTRSTVMCNHGNYSPPWEYSSPESAIWMATKGL